MKQTQKYANIEAQSVTETTITVRNRFARLLLWNEPCPNAAGLDVAESTVPDARVSLLRARTSLICFRRILV